jgi:uncharacterized protein
MPSHADPMHRVRTARSKLEAAFGITRVLLPVVHPVGEREALASVRTAADAGCRGVFLINQGMGQAQVLQLVRRVRELHPSLWVGVNLLGLSPADALKAALDACDGRIDGLWTDNAGVDGVSPDAAADELLAARRDAGWDGLYFGGVAFKYQDPVADERLADVARAAARYMDVVCTSGPGTGMAASPHKTDAMRRGLGDHGALALASGVTADNVADYGHAVDVFIVGTSLEVSEGRLLADRIESLLAGVGGSSPANASSA